jgi:hypothetical protein
MGFRKFSSIPISADMYGRVLGKMSEEDGSSQINKADGVGLASCALF